MNAKRSFEAAPRCSAQRVPCVVSTVVVVVDVRRAEMYNAVPRTSKLERWT